MIMVNRMKSLSFFFMTVFVGFSFSGCVPENSDDFILISLVVDGRERIFQLSETFTVEEFLAQGDVGVVLADRDRITPLPFTQLSDGDRITIVRVTEETLCEREDIPFEQEIVLNEGLRANEERIAQVGQNGVQEICYRVEYEDGIERQRIRDGQVTIITAPTNEILIVGLETELDPITIEGTLAYINNGNAWIIQGNSTTKRPLTRSSDLDGMVLSLSPDGRYLMYTRQPADEGSFVNELWLIETTGDRSPVKLIPTDVLYAEWVPNQENVISYSTGEVQELFPGWRALNNVWTARIDPESGQTLNVAQVVRESGGGLSGWWGTVYRWSPEGDQLAWVRADSSGIVDEEGALVTLTEYAPFRTSQPWSWRADISWSADGSLLATTVHGPPIGNEPPDTSPVFNVSVMDVRNTFRADVVEAAGMWSAPKFSPQVVDNSPFPRGYLAYLRARVPYGSVSGEYDLVVADRDGSNARVVFPQAEQVGITTTLQGLTSHDYVWSPSGRQIALMYRGNLWIVDVETLVRHQLTFDAQSQYPVWSR